MHLPSLQSSRMTSHSPQQRRAGVGSPVTLCPSVPPPQFCQLPRGRGAVLPHQTVQLAAAQSCGAPSRPVGPCSLQLQDEPRTALKGAPCQPLLQLLCIIISHQSVYLQSPEMVPQSGPSCSSIFLMSLHFLPCSGAVRRLHTHPGKGLWLLQHCTEVAAIHCLATPTHRSPSAAQHHAPSSLREARQVPKWQWIV